MIHLRLFEALAFSPKETGKLKENFASKNQRLLETAAKLGRKLMALDKEAEVKEAQRRAEQQSQMKKKAEEKAGLRF